MRFINKNINYFKLLVIAIIIAFLGRLIITPFGNHWDVAVNTGWAKWMHFEGFRGFYENTVWYYVGPSQLPLINLIYAGNYEIFLGLSKIINIFFGQNVALWFNSIYQNTPYRIGEIIAMKIIPIFSDIAISLLIFYIGKKKSSLKIGFLGAVLYLFFPFSFYISSLWGQYDQLSILLLILSFAVFYFDKKGLFKVKNMQFILSAVLFFSAFEIKPTVFFTLPLYLYFLYKKRQSWSSLAVAAVTGFLLTLVTTFPFTDTSPIKYLFNNIYPVVVNSDRFFTSTHAFNFWSLISPVEVSSWYNKILGFRYVQFGELVILILNIVSILIINKHRNIKGLFLSLYITTAGGAIFAAGMVERYFFAGVVVLLLLSVLIKSIFPLWFLSAALFSFDLYLSWGFPNNPNLPDYFWLNHGIVQILSLIQIILYFSAIYFSLRSLNKYNG